MPLAPETAAYLEAESTRPPRSSLSIAQTRKAMERLPEAGGDPPRLANVRDEEPNPEFRVRMYEPENAPDSVALYFHGGRFISGGLDSHDAVCRHLAGISGCRIAAIDYRLAPEHRFPAAADDAVAAVRWALRRWARVAVAGDSAGGNLAAVAALAMREAILAQVLVYPMTDATRSLPSHREYATGYGPGSDDMERGWGLYVSPGADRRDERISPLFARSLTGLPPALVLTAEYDSLRDEGEAYAERLREAGVPVELERCAGVVHGFFGMPGLFPSGYQALGRAAEFLRKRLSGT